jgi:hypothetical protein
MGNQIEFCNKFGEKTSFSPVFFSFPELFKSYIINM